MRRSRGFTFLEVIIVVMIIAGLAGVTIPKLTGSFRRGRITKDVREMISTLRQARNIAVLRGSGVELVFDPENGVYLLDLIDFDMSGLPLDDEGVDIEDEMERLGLSEEVFRIHKLDKKLFFSLVHASAPLSHEELPRVIYYPDGSATAAWVGIQDDYGKALGIQVYRTTGMSKVTDGVPIIPENEQPLFISAESVPVWEIIK